MFKGNKRIAYAVIYAIIVLGIIMTFNYAKVEMTTQTIPYSQFKTMLVANEVQSVVVEGNEIQVTPKKGTKDAGKTLYVTRMNDPELVSSLEKAGVQFEAKIPQSYPMADLLLSYVLPFAFLMIIGKFMFGRIDKRMGGGVMSFGKNNAKVYAEAETGVTFDDVAGQDEAKESLKEIVDFLHDTERYVSIGAKLPKGALLVGPPGTGKTLLAKAVAGEAKVPFFSLAGSDFVEMFVGMGAARVRDLFKQAEEKAPCIVFIDEIDAVGRQRGAGVGGGHDEREQTLNQLLVEMDGFGVNEGIIMIAATNRPDILDSALLRPGRFDRQILVAAPDVAGREEVLKVHVRNKKLSEEIDLAVLAKRTPGFTGADLENLTNEAALLAVRGNKKEIDMEDMEEAITRVIAGPEKKSKVISEHDKKLTAYHEAGHAVVMRLLPNADPVHEISIIPRGMAGGYTMNLPTEDRSYTSKSKLKDDMVGLLGGRIAEQLVMGDISTGAKNDIDRVSSIARAMVMQYGMSEKIGTISFGENNGEVFLGREISKGRNVSEEISAEIDKEVKALVSEAYERAESLLKANMSKLDAVAQVLIEKEKIDGEEFENIFVAS